MNTTLRIVLLQPDPGDLISGGYLYNAAVGRELKAIGLGELQTREFEDLSAVSAADYLLLDSLYLSRTPPPRVLESMFRGGTQLYVLAHYFPPANPRLSKSAIDQWEHSARAWLTHCKGVITTGYGMREPWQTWLGERHSVGVAPPAVRAGHRTGRRRSSRDVEIRVLTIGGLTAGKNQRTLLEHIAGRSQRNFHWQLIGSTKQDPAYARDFRRALGEYDLAGRVSVSGSLPHDDTLNALRESDLFVSTSLFETFGLAAAEALASGVPTLAFDVGDIRSWCGGLDGVWLHPVDDITSFLRTFDALVDTPGRLDVQPGVPQFTPRTWRQTLTMLLESMHVAPAWVGCTG
ncbi:MAG: glycosyltransferase family 4 protein [Pseudomonadota bacterium]